MVINAENSKWVESKHIKTNIHHRRWKPHGYRLIRLPAAMLAVPFVIWDSWTQTHESVKLHSL